MRLKYIVTVISVITILFTCDTKEYTGNTQVDSLGVPIDSTFVDIIQSPESLITVRFPNPDSIKIDLLYQWLQERSKITKVSADSGIFIVTILYNNSDSLGYKKSLHFAQCMQESLFDPEAVSYVGALGLFQFMPATAKDIGINPLDIYQSSTGNIYYMNFLKRWSKKLKGLDEEKVRVASYNAGMGNTRKTIMRAENEGIRLTYENTIVRHLPSITGRHSNETLTYVRKIYEYIDKFNKILGI